MDSESDEEQAQASARRHHEFWTLVFTSGTMSYSEWTAMDLAEYCEAREAWIIYQEERKQQAGRS